MKIIVCKWGAYTEDDLIQSLSNMGIKVYPLISIINDKSVDEKFEKLLKDKIDEVKAEAVFSVNYFPLMAKCCYAKDVKYISWSYDAPLNVINIEETLNYPTNYAFMFDKMQAWGYKSKGFDTVYHLPLAVAVNRYDKIEISSSDQAKYGSDISFVGNLYSDDFRKYISPLNDYQKGYLEAIASCQKQLYGCYILDEIIDEKLVDEINKSYQDKCPGTEFRMNSAALKFAMASNITRDERLTLLGLLSKFHSLNYYSKEKNIILENANFKGYCDYYNEMPKVFKCSKINLNISLKAIQTGIPLRALDVMGSGGFLLSNYQEELAENFTDGVDLILYSSIEEAFEKVNFYLKDSKRIADIAENGYKKVKEFYNYEIRIKEMFEIAKIL